MKKLRNEVELDTKITPELREEGIIREIIRNIQEMRKESRSNTKRPSFNSVFFFTGLN